MVPDGVRVVTVVDEENDDDYASRDAVLLREFDRYLASHPTDVVLVLGDRHELLAVTLAATLRRVPIAHVHGGEVTFGAFDDGVRHAVTKLSHLHLVATAAAGDRVRQLGEEPWRVTVVGAPGLDAVVRRERRDDATAHLLGRTVQRPVALLTFHPVTAISSGELELLDAVLEALASVPTVIATAPGLDPGRELFAERLERWCRDAPGREYFESLGDAYLDVLGDVDLVIGNSSSGVIEAPSIARAVIDVGVRQAGRERAPGVLHAPNPASVAALVALATSGEAPALGTNPYGDGTASRRICDVLAKVDRDRLLEKRFVDLTDTAA